MAITEDIRDAIVMHICHYLRGHGHPDHPRLDGIVTDDMREAVIEDKTYRLRSFLQLMSGSSMLPASESQKLEVRH
jgi:LmbE family N-acetylglucosaminyl deacetylase